MEQSKMDLPNLSSDPDQTLDNKDKLKKDSQVITPNSDSPSPESIDTGFVSDGNHEDSPSPLSEEKTNGNLPLAEGTGSIQSEDNKNSEANISKDEGGGKSDRMSENNETETLNSSTAIEETEKFHTTDNEENGLMKEETQPSNVSDINKSETSSSADLKEAINESNEDYGYVDILGNGLLKKKVLHPGAGVETRPTNGEVITLKVKGHLGDGTQIEDGEITFVLNDGDVIVAFELAAALMEQGEQCELFTSSRYAYGELGREPDIPKDANITYTLELLDVKPPTNPATLSCDERHQLGEQKRERGNYLFKRTDYSGAINSYTKAVKLLDDTDLNAGLDEGRRAQLADCWSKCYNNMAACQLKIDALDAAIRSCEKVLSHQSENIKALFRLGKAHGAKGDVDTAISYLKKAIKLDPESKIMHQEMLALSRRKSKETESERMLYQRMLGVKSEKSQAKADDKKKNGASIMKWTLVLGAVTAAMVSVGLTWYRNS